MEPRQICFELLKTASALDAVSRAARWVTHSPGRGAALGAGLGAAHGAVQNRDQGLAGATAGALRGGLRGGLVGGAAAGLGRAYRDTRLLDPSMSAAQAVGGTAKRLGQGVKNFGKRQAHGFTGAYADQAGEIGLRSTAAATKKIDLLKRRAADELQYGNNSDARQWQTYAKYVERAADAKEWGQQGDKAMAAGITSIPGVARGLARAPVNTVKALGRDMIGGGGNKLMGATTALGVPLAIAAPDLARGDETAQGGRSLKQKLVGVGSGLAGGFLTAGMPVLPNIVGGIAVDAVANKTLGRSKTTVPRLEA